ncbi:ABC transporter permease [Flavilitoribacter nigricans]|uniref:FtsX-like permease family protein n=1 Tax=Flavilitoribacter nigricans (strain ATCC 23147 / DSM 23189 / NBRC 102662 / NCIMB 1420 / SS-2) TaxID=1122177 RepID=A0A2D0NA68_FLAN2|nr:ABC transporter permease [Flavilitoribacter nigricans]PHN05278.1 hypothetical protein CRP01_17330 [Flavilitoribacter nigricans DSM 23189 = NBRC 102662]
MTPQPPKTALRFLRWFCREDYLEEIEGDLIEVFEQQYADAPRWSGWKFTWQVLLHFRPDFIRSLSNHPLIYTSMYRHYLKIAWRNLLRQRMYTLINLSGLTIGLSCFILIALYLQYEQSYDWQHENADRIYRVAQRQEGNVFRGTDEFAVTPEPLAPALQANFPEVEAAATLTVEQGLLYREDEYLSSQLLYADDKAFDIFTIPILQGQGPEALSDPETILLSRSLAEKHFGSADPLGQTLKLNDERPLTVRGVFADPPGNQHFAYDAILPIGNIYYFESDVGRWSSNNYRTYLRLAEGADHRELEKRMALFDDEVEAAYKNLPFRAEFFLQPLLDIHLRSRINMEMGVNGDIRYVYLLGAIGLIILLLASINYMNLATARSVRRVKEVGVRKVMGAERQQLVGQLLGESFMLTLFSFVLAVGLAYLLLPGFNHLLDQSIPFDVVGSGWLLTGLLLTAILIGGLSGLYPSLVLSALSPVQAFQRKLAGSFRQGISLRNVLIVGQFTAAVVLAVSSVVVYQQLQYIQHKKLGYNRDQIAYVPFFSEQVDRKMSSIRSELLAHPGIQKVSVSNNLILNTGNQGIVDQWEGNDKTQNLYCYRYFVDEEFLDLYEIPLAAGRNFSTAFPTDSTQSYLLNESAVQAIGWTPETAIGKSFRDGQVIGVVEDFHFQPMDLKIEPLFLKFRHPQNQPTRFGNLAVKLNTDDLQHTLAFVLGVFERAAPRTPFEYRFLDASYDQLYASEKRLGQAFSIFTFLALFIACMGLFGLVSFQIVQRTREIGIRKVLGASALKLVELLSKDFLRLVAIALLLAVPIAWLAMQRWLDGFAYRIEIKWWVFLLVALPALIISLLTVGLQSLRAARANPVESLQ